MATSHHNMTMTSHHHLNPTQYLNPIWPPAGHHHLNMSMTTLCKGNLTDLRRILHLSLAKGNPKI
jgi:hypothetical protein